MRHRIYLAQTKATQGQLCFGVDHLLGIFAKKPFRTNSTGLGIQLSMQAFTIIGEPFQQLLSY
jgi:hypothetical protein